MKKNMLIAAILAALALTSCNAPGETETTGSNETSGFTETTAATEPVNLPEETVTPIQSGKVTMALVDADYDSIRLLGKNTDSYYAVGKDGKYYLADRRDGSAEFTLLMEEGFDEIEMVEGVVYCDGKKFSNGSLSEPTDSDTEKLNAYLAEKKKNGVEGGYGHDFYIDPNDMKYVYYLRGDGLFEKDHYPNFYGPLYGSFRSVGETTPVTLEDGTTVYRGTATESNWGLMLWNDRVVLEGVYERVIDRTPVLVKQGGKYAAFRTDGYEGVTRVSDFEYDLPDYLQSGSRMTTLVKDGKYGILDEAGEEYLPFEYDYITDLHRDGNVFILSEGRWYIASLLPAKPQGEGTVFTRNGQGIITGSSADHPLTFTYDGVSVTSADMAEGTEWFARLEAVLDNDFAEEEDVIESPVAGTEGGGNVNLKASSHHISCGESRSDKMYIAVDDFFAVNGLEIYEKCRDEAASVFGVPTDVEYEYYGVWQTWSYHFENGDELTLEFVGDTLRYVELERSEK